MEKDVIPGAVGLIGLGVMGENFALNLADHGIPVVLWNRTASKLAEFKERTGGNPRLIPAATLKEFASALSAPRKVLLFVKAGEAVDDVLEALRPYLAPGDVPMDCGNSFFRDTEMRQRRLAEDGVRLLGVGISGGAEGARRGPSIMPGGDETAWPVVRELLQSVGARASDGESCCQWVGPGGSGHLVKTIHNGIEYGMMELIAETAWLFLRAGFTPEECSAFFATANRERLAGYLVAITSDILLKRDDYSGRKLLELVRDSAGGKGTGRWTVDLADELDCPVPTIAAALATRYESSDPEMRHAISGRYEKRDFAFPTTRELWPVLAGNALYAALLVNYAQGFALLKRVSAKFDCAVIAGIWRAGCIIRSAALEPIRREFQRDPECRNLLNTDFFADELTRAGEDFRRLTVAAINSGTPAPAFSATVGYLDAMRCTRLPTALVEAQRDCFGDHRFERLDHPRGEFFHADWRSL